MPTVASTTTETYGIIVKDSLGATSTQRTASVTANPALGTPSITSANTPIDANQIENVVANAATGGSAPVTYSLLANSGSGYASTGAACALSGSSVKCTYSPTTAGNYIYEITATDSASNAVTTTSAPSSQVTVYPPLVVVILDPTIDLGQTITLHAGVSGGSSSYVKYAWSGSGSDPACSSLSSTTNSVMFTPTSAVMCTVTLTVTDSVGNAQSNTGVVTVSGAFIAPSGITITSPIDSGQTETVTANAASGGTGPITYQLLVSSNGITFAPASTQNCVVSGATVTCTNAPSTGTYYEIQATDTGTSPNYMLNTGPSTKVTVNNALIAPSGIQITSPITDGQTETVTANAASGGTGTITYQLLVSTDGTTFAPASTQNCVVSSGIVTCTDTPSTSVYYEIQATDTGTSPNYMLNTGASTEVTVNPPATTTTIVPTGVGGGGGGGGGGAFKPTVVPYTNGNQTGFTILNFSDYNTESLNVENVIFDIQVNYITPTSAGLTINGQSLVLTPNATVEIYNNTGFGYYVELLNISYLAIMHEDVITLRINGQPVVLQAVIPTGTTGSTTAQQPTQATSTSTSTVSTTTTTISSTTSTSGSSSNALIPLLGSGIAIAVAIALGLAYSRRRRSDDDAVER